MTDNRQTNMYQVLSNVMADLARIDPQFRECLESALEQQPSPTNTGKLLSEDAGGTSPIGLTMARTPHTRATEIMQRQGIGSGAILFDAADWNTLERLFGPSQRDAHVRRYRFAMSAAAFRRASEAMERDIRGAGSVTAFLRGA